MPGVLAAATGSDWTEGGALFTFWFPLGLFIIIAAILYLVLTRPHTVPGHKPLALARPGGAAGQATETTAREGAGTPPASPAGSTAPDQRRASADDRDTPGADA